METPENCMVLKMSGIKEDSGVAQGTLLPLADIPHTVATWLFTLYTEVPSLTSRSAGR